MFGHGIYHSTEKPIFFQGKGQQLSNTLLNYKEIIIQYRQGYVVIHLDSFRKVFMRHKNSQGIAYSVFPFGSSRQMFLVGEPEEQYTCQNDIQGQERTIPDYPKQVRNLLENVKNVCEKEGFSENVIGMWHFFLADIGMQQLVQQLADEMFPNSFGAKTYVPQAPASGAVIALELWTMCGDVNHFEIDFGLNDSASGKSAVAKFDKMRWFFGGGYQPYRYSFGAYERSADAFSGMHSLLKEHEFELDQVLRTWIYQGHLLQPEGGTQRYKELNRARTDFFGKTRFLQDYLPKGYKGRAYPASTGIGADALPNEQGDVVISAVALDTKRKDVIAVPLENPNQTSAFDYGEVYSPQSPKFSRAMAVAVDDTCLIFVSGTASITDSESRHIGAPVKQTEQTLDNIAALITGENLERHGISDFVCSLENLECVRVYVKRQSELEVIRQVCERRLPEVPTIYTVADVCRPELLVEIEGVAIARR